MLFLQSGSCWDAVSDAKWINGKDAGICTQIQIRLCKPISGYWVRQQQQRWSHLPCNRNILKFIAFICKLTDHVPHCVKCDFFKIFFSSSLMFRASVILISFHWQNKYCSICALLQSATAGLKHLSSGCQVVCKGTGKQLILDYFAYNTIQKKVMGAILICTTIIPKLC